VLGLRLADIDHPRHAELVNAHAELVAQTCFRMGIVMVAPVDNFSQ
jgi:hypothetical protein